MQKTSKMLFLYSFLIMSFFSSIFACKANMDSSTVETISTQSYQEIKIPVAMTTRLESEDTSFKDDNMSEISNSFSETHIYEWPKLNSEGAFIDLTDEVCSLFELTESERLNADFAVHGIYNYSLLISLNIKDHTFNTDLKSIGIATYDLKRKQLSKLLVANEKVRIWDCILYDGKIYYSCIKPSNEFPSEDLNILPHKVEVHEFDPEQKKDQIIDHSYSYDYFSTPNFRIFNHQLFYMISGIENVINSKSLQLRSELCVFSGKAVKTIFEKVAPLTDEMFVDNDYEYLFPTVGRLECSKNLLVFVTKKGNSLILNSYSKDGRLQAFNLGTVDNVLIYAFSEYIAVVNALDEPFDDHTVPPDRQSNDPPKSRPLKLNVFTPDGVNVFSTELKSFYFVERRIPINQLRDAYIGIDNDWHLILMQLTNDLHLHFAKLRPLSGTVGGVAWPELKEDEPSFVFQSTDSSILIVYYFRDDDHQPRFVVRDVEMIFD